MNLKTLSWFLWPVLVLIGIGIWWSVSDTPSQSAGQRIYQQYCANCHMEQGQGLAKLIPPLADADYFRALPDGQLVCIIRYGQQDTIRVNGVRYDRPMPPNALISEVEMVALIRYMRQQWDENAADEISYEALMEYLEACPR